VIVIFQGRRYRLISQSAQSVWVAPRGTRQRPIVVARTNPDLIMEPTADDLELAEGFERGDIGAFEYADGHTYPPHREISTTGKRRKSSRRIH
jgi:hypothetical protein